MGFSYRFVFVGRNAKDPLLGAAQTYHKRLLHYAKSEILRIKESNPAQEGEKILQKLDPHDVLVALDEHGVSMSTRELAQALEGYSDEGRVVFVTGGADGLSEQVRERAQLIWSLSRLTLPHRLAQTVLLEQIYRAHTVLRGEQYHRD